MWSAEAPFTVSKNPPITTSPTAVVVIAFTRFVGAVQPSSVPAVVTGPEIRTRLTGQRRERPADVHGGGPEVEST